MKKHINGWDLVENKIKQLNLTQTKLANALEISASAITQMKQEKILINPKHIEKIIKFLKFDKDTTEAFYLSLFNNRMKNNRQKLKEGKKEHLSQINLPIIDINQLLNYQSPFEHITTFVKKHCHFKMKIPKNSGDFGIISNGTFLNDMFFPQTLFLIAGKKYPKNGDFVIAYFSNKMVQIGYFFKSNTSYELKLLNNKSIYWNAIDDFNFLLWLYPIIEVRNFQN